MKPNSCYHCRLSAISKVFEISPHLSCECHYLYSSQHDTVTVDTHNGDYECKGTCARTHTHTHTHLSTNVQTHIHMHTHRYRSRYASMSAHTLPHTEAYKGTPVHQTHTHRHTNAHKGTRAKSYATMHCARRHTQQIITATPAHTKTLC